MWDSPMHLLIVAIVILVLFGGRKIPELMRGLGEGVRGFKEGMSGAQASSTPPPPPPAAAPAEKPAEEKKA
jgi:sec-independent protein translocase protein TatA